MAAFGILAALRERDRIGRGPARRRLDGRRRAVVAGDGRRAATSPTAACRARGELPLGGRARLLPALRAAPTAGSRSARWSRSSGAAWCRGVGREDLIERQFDAPGSRRARARSRRSSPRRTRAEWEAFAAEHDCCLEPVLELDEALDSELVRAREMVVELDQPGARAAGARCSACRSSSSRTPGDADRAARARRSASTPTRCCARPATATRRSPR